MSWEIPVFLKLLDYIPYLKKWLGPAIAIELRWPNPIEEIRRNNEHPSLRFNIGIKLHREDFIDIKEIMVNEQGVGDWTINLIESQESVSPLTIPIKIEQSTDLWITARSPKVLDWRDFPWPVGALTLKIRDSTQKDEKFHHLQLTNTTRYVTN